MARQENHQTGIRKLSVVGGKSYAVSIPIEVIKQLGWKKGDTLLVRRHATTIVIEKKEQ
jgi:antitoxin component of MazEF toxin-antitoxin module